MPVHGYVIHQQNETLSRSRNLAVFLGEDHGGRSGAHRAALAEFHHGYQNEPDVDLRVWGLPAEYTPECLRR